MGISFGITLLLGLLSAVGPFSTDVYLPAFSQIDHEFGRVGAAQFTLAAWFVGVAIGQILQGPLSDRVGRRIPLLYGTALYAAASIGCALATGLASFSAFRMLAALGGSASMVVPRAVIRDTAEGIDAARLLARLVLIMGVVPILAPALGGLMMTVMSWRMLFWVAGLYGAICAVLVWRYLPDTLPPQMRLRHTLAETVIRYLQIAREPVFVTNVLMSSFSFALLFTYIGASALVYTRYFHLSPPQYGMLFGVSALGFVFASQCTARLAARFGIDPVLHGGTMLLFGGFALAAVDAFAHLGGLAGMAIPIFVGQAAIGLMAPLMTVNALSHHRSRAGSASALMGTWQFSLGALAGMLVGFTADGTPRPMAMLMVTLAVVVVVIDRLRPPSTLAM